MNELLENYQRFTDSAVVYPKEQTDPEVVEAMYLGLGLGGEAGEVLEHIKKWHRDGGVDTDAVLAELGDVLWYVSQLCNLFGFKMEYVIGYNMAKLQSRMDREKIHGKGDER